MLQVSQSTKTKSKQKTLFEEQAPSFFYGACLISSSVNAFEDFLSQAIENSQVGQAVVATKTKNEKRSKKNFGPTQNRTEIKRSRVSYTNRYTMGPCYIFLSHLTYSGYSPTILGCLSCNESSPVLGRQTKSLTVPSTASYDAVNHRKRQAMKRDGGKASAAVVVVVETACHRTIFAPTGAVVGVPGSLRQSMKVAVHLAPPLFSSVSCSHPTKINLLCEFLRCSN